MASRKAGGSFTLRLLAVLLVPLAGFGYLAVERIDDARATASEARRSADDARVQQTVAGVYSPAHLEQVAMEGFAAVDALGLPRDLVVALTGIDLATWQEEQSVLLDAALDDLTTRHGSLEVRTVDRFTNATTTLADRLAPIRIRIASLREASDRREASADEVSDAFGELGVLLADTTDATAGRENPTASARLQQWRVAALTGVIVAEGASGRAVLNALIDRTPTTALAAAESSSMLGSAISSFTAVLDTDERAEFDELIGDLRPLPDELIGPEAIAGAAPGIDPAFINIAVDAFLDRIEFQAGVAEYMIRFHESMVAELQTSADEAERVAMLTSLGFAVVAIASLLLLLLLAWSLLRPLRRLTQHAATISTGNFDSEALPVGGPSNIRTLTTTMNEMMSTLRNVDHQITALSNAESIAQQIELPGSVGVSLRRSFEHLERTTAQLHASEQLSSAIVEQAADAIWTIDEQGLIRSANRASERLVGVDAADQIGRSLSDHLSALDGEINVRSPTGNAATMLVASYEIDGHDEHLTAVVAHDISERARYEDRLQHQATHDALTGLPNRRAVLDRLAASEPDAPIAILFVDLDGFKSVNDTRGHIAGDRVLTEVGTRLRRRVRPADFVGRLGGDEFVVITSDAADSDDVVAFGNRIIRELEIPHRDEEHLFTLSASVGAAVFPDGLTTQGHSPIDAIRYADSAVYAAKHHGRGRVELFDANLQARVVRDAEIELALRRAVPNGELVLHLQPILDLRTGDFSGAEALVRWNRPGIGMVPPGEFIPVAERSSLIFEIDRWVLTNACETIALWQSEHPDVDNRIAVNIAGSHLIEGNLIADLDRALSMTGADPRLLEFEITETQMMHDVHRAAEVLEQIRERGVTVAIDDFGTGYSSMSYLRQLPIDTLKIDGSFIANVMEPGFDPTVLDALFTIGHALGLDVVAEGIEHAEQLDYVSAHGCERAQGYHLARPMSVDDAEQLLRRAPAAVSDLTG